MPKLFSYGTLRQEDVRRLTFGRPLAGAPDALVGYRRSTIGIDDPEVVRASGKAGRLSTPDRPPRDDGGLGSYNGIGTGL